jgi:uncharacterized membrane protein
MLKKLFFTTLLVIFTLISAHLLIETSAQVEEPIVVNIDTLGLAFIQINGTFIGSEYLQCIGEPLYIYSFYPSDLVTYLDLESKTILLMATSDQPVNYNLTYVSLVAKPVDTNSWVSQLYVPTTTLFILPEGSVVKQVNPPPRETYKIGNKIAILVSPGNITISYVLPSAQPPPVTSPAVTGTQTQATTTSTSTPTTSPSTSTTAQPATPKTTYIAIVLVIVTLAIAVYYLVSRKKASKGKSDIEAYLDDRDRAIINYLKEKGSATPTELMEATGIPKSAFYRRISRLEKLGIIEIVDLGMKKVYRLKEKPS